MLECYMVAGGFDYLVKTRLSDMTAYRRFLGDVLLALPGVKETRTYAVMEEVRSYAPLPRIGAAHHRQAGCRIQEHDAARSFPSTPAPK